MADNTEIQRRRTFAIIAHPDAGKTSLTEKLLLFGGQIQVAGVQWQLAASVLLIAAMALH